MEDSAGCRKSSSGCARKRTRKRPYTRKASLSTTFINMAEARREIYDALQLHRSSSSSTTTINPAVPCSSSYNYQIHQPQQQMQLMDSMPHPEPTWSTTAPAVLCPPVPTIELLEAEWFDDVSSSCAWWMAFLTSLDRNKPAGADQTTNHIN